MLQILFSLLQLFSCTDESIYENDIITVFMTIEYKPENFGDKKTVTLVIDLFNKDQPKSVRNFRTLLLKEGGYKMSYFYELFGPCLIGGDYENNTGSGGQSIYGEPFNEYTGIYKHEAGSLAGLPNHDGNVGSQFYLFNQELPFYDTNTVFGKVREECLESLFDIYNVRTIRGKPVPGIRIVDCGDYVEDRSDL